MTPLNGKYVLERRLGGGGMAEVFLARTVGAEGFSRWVAIKRILPGYSESPQFARMFVAEAQLSSRLQHPNVVAVADFDRDGEGRLFLVMELVEGVDLDGLNQTGLLPFPLVIHLIAEALRGLGYAHDLPPGGDGVRGLIHRDVSPHNVLLSWEGAVKVSDFGIAKARSASDATASEMIKGKPAYMSPEQANGEPLDGRSDLFAIGVMLWEMLTGRPLFAGETTQATLARLLFAPIVAPRQLRPEVPADLERVAMRLLERDRAARYPTAAAAIDDLVACADHPRSGRELLIAALAQRFAGKAPVRAASAAVPQAQLDVPASAPSTVRLPGPLDGRPPAANVHASTAIAPRRGRAALWAALGLLGVVGAVIAIVVASDGDATPANATATTPVRPAPPASTRGSAAASAPPPASPATTAAAPPGPPQTAAAPLDAGTTEAAPPAHAHAPNPSTKPPAKHGGAGIVEVKLGGS
jgi:serine/threonine-protein kinase